MAKKLKYVQLYIVQILEKLLLLKLNRLQIRLCNRKITIFAKFIDFQKSFLLKMRFANCNLDLDLNFQISNVLDILLKCRTLDSKVLPLVCYVSFLPGKRRFEEDGVSVSCFTLSLVVSRHSAFIHLPSLRFGKGFQRL